MFIIICVFTSIDYCVLFYHYLEYVEHNRLTNVQFSGIETICNLVNFVNSGPCKMLSSALCFAMQAHAVFVTGVVCKSKLNILSPASYAM